MVSLDCQVYCMPTPLHVHGSASKNLSGTLATPAVNSHPKADSASAIHSDDKKQALQLQMLASVVTKHHQTCG